MTLQLLVPSPGVACSPSRLSLPKRFGCLLGKIGDEQGRHHIDLMVLQVQPQDLADLAYPPSQTQCSSMQQLSSTLRLYNQVNLIIHPKFIQISEGHNDPHGQIKHGLLMFTAWWTLNFIPTKSLLMSFLNSFNERFPFPSWQPGSAQERRVAGEVFARSLSVLVFLQFTMKLRPCP